MKKYAVIDMTNGDWFEAIFDTQEEALNRAEYEWHIMAKADKARREAFFVAAGEVDEDGCFDLNTADVIKEYV